jgi:hypothetical protein
MGVLAMRSESSDSTFCGRFAPLVKLATEERRLEDREEGYLGEDEPDYDDDEYASLNHQQCGGHTLSSVTSASSSFTFDVKLPLRMCDYFGSHDQYTSDQRGDLRDSQ